MFRFRQILSGENLVRNARKIQIVGLTLVVLAGIAAAISAFGQAEADDMAARAVQVRAASRLLLVNLQDAETGQRGYLLTHGGDAYLEPFRRAAGIVPYYLRRLFALTTDNPLQQQRLKALQPMIKAKFDELWLTIHLERQGHHDEALGVINTDHGKRVMDGIRARLEVILGTQTELLARRQSQAGALRILIVAFIAVTLAAAVALTALLSGAMENSLARLKLRTEELEQEIVRRREAENTLHQAQKMEAVGQLTGGIAHDFNNLLTIIIGNLDTIARRLAKRGAENDMELMKPVTQAQQGASSAARLTHRLLAFSRRQMLAPAPLDLNRLVQGMSEMIRRTLGEAINVETVLAGGLWQTFADPNQVENALLNLAINARDAMPGGGHLTIETANTWLDENYVARFGDIGAGQYVQLTVTDTGTGIAPELMSKVFEPFFTTKTGGAGSGLGLAMVYGFVRQSGGHVRIYSEVGHGTTVKIYLPRLEGTSEEPAQPGDRPEVASREAKPGEIILVVEDDQQVREYARDALTELGYAVITASDANDAMQIAAGGERIDLLFTDVVLPGGVSGRELARRICEKRPGLPVLFTTGYTRNAIIHGGRLDSDVQLLNKPYTMRDLARKVRERIEAAQR